MIYNRDGILAFLFFYYLYFRKKKKKKAKEENFTQNDIEDNLEIEKNIDVGKKEKSVKKREKSSRKKENVEMSNESLLEQLRKIRQEDN